MRIKVKPFLLVLVILLFNCNGDDDAISNICDESYVASEITNTFSATNGYSNIMEGKPLEVHHYAIRILEDGQICSVGYQSPANYSGTYTIKITNNNNGFIYEEDFSFSQSELEFHEISETLNVQSGDYISVLRTITPGYSNINQAKGRIIEKADNSAIVFPINGVNVKFIGSSFEGGGASEFDTAIPYIGLGFEVN